MPAGNNIKVPRVGLGRACGAVPGSRHDYLTEATFRLSGLPCQRRPEPEHAGPRRRTAHRQLTRHELRNASLPGPAIRSQGDRLAFPQAQADAESDGNAVAWVIASSRASSADPGSCRARRYCDHNWTQDACQWTWR